MRGNRRRRSAAAAARNAREIIRIVYRAEGEIVAGPAIGQFVQIRLAEHDGAGAAQRRDHGCVLRRAKIPQRRRAAGRGVVPGIDAVLDRNGKAEQRSRLYSGDTLAIAGPGVLQHSRRIQGDERIEGVRGLAAGEQGLRIFFRGERSLRHVRDRIGRAEVAEIRGRAGTAGTREAAGGRRRLLMRRPPTWQPWRSCPTRRHAARSQLGSDMIPSQRLAHAVHRAAAVADHRHVGIVDRKTFRAAGGNEILAGGGHQHALLAQGHHVGAQLHGVAVGNGYGADPLRPQPVHEFRFHRLHADHGQALGKHAHLHIQMQKMRIESVGVKLPTLRLEPALHLPDSGLDGTFARVAAGRHPRLQHHEVPALDIARSDQIVNRNAGIEIELQAGRILAAAIGLLQLHDHGAPGSHDAAVAGEDLIGQRRLRCQEVHRDLRLPVDIDHLVVLPARHREIELQADTFGALTDGVARLPGEMIDGSDQYVAQRAVFAVDPPGLERFRAAAVDSRAQLHRESLPSRDLGCRRTHHSNQRMAACLIK